ncbi:MAG: CYTH domain-containing protein [Gammaproteobacteria bacterium]|nr:CYTH domain-containing protein [Gammaproteobacteria bacterium]
MAKEIERKFLVVSDNWKEDVSNSIIFKQGYFKGDNLSASIRVRIEGDVAKLNIKGATIGIVRDEFEYDIPIEEANQLLSLYCKKPYIEKTRYYVNYQSHLFEIDEFIGDNKGLVVAEVELSSENESIDLPDWVGEDVSEQTKYYNNNLVENPFKQW